MVACWLDFCKISLRIALEFQFLKYTDMLVAQVFADDCLNFLCGRCLLLQFEPVLGMMLFHVQVVLRVIIFLFDIAQLVNVSDDLLVGVLNHFCFKGFTCEVIRCLLLFG